MHDRMSDDALRAESFDLDRDVRTRAAWLYYMEGLTQDAVGQILGMTRARVLKMLAEARQDGTVQIRVTTPLRHCVLLERQLETRFGLERAIVIPRPVDQDRATALIGAATGAYLSEVLADGMTIGLGWGRTLSLSLPHMPNRAFQGVSVVSLLGGLTRVSSYNPSEFAWRFADRISADCYLMAAPAYAPNARTRDALMSHPGIKDVFDHSKRLDLAILSVGDMAPGSTLVTYELLKRSEMASLQRAGAVGDILCRFIDAEGRVLDHPVNNRVIAADPRDLRSAKRLVLASGGRHKAPAVLAALRLLRPEVLITDETVAETLTAGDAAG
jgi:DNA-binding transcriptional regulator LsrR (DeoR family)